MCLPEFCFGLCNGWWFLLVFIIMNITLMIIYPFHYTKRLFKLPNLSKSRVSGAVYALVLNGTMIYSVFVSIKFHAPSFWLGLSLFALTGVLFFVTMYDYATTNPDKPVVKGIYRYSRNPQQLLAVLMWIGVSIATQSIIMFILCIMQLFLMYPTLVAQEQFCICKYGEEYIEYMKKVPRYFWKL